MKKLSLFIFIDAFGWEIYKNTNFLKDITKTESNLGTIFGYSCTCDPTIISGVLPYEHRHFSFFYYDPKNSPFKIWKFLDVFPKSIINRGRVRNQISKLMKKYHQYTGYFQIYNVPFNYIKYFDYCEKKDIYQKDGLNGKNKTIFDYLREKNISFHLTNWRLKEIDAYNNLIQDLKKGEITFAYLYWAEMDAILHRDGTKAKSVYDKIASYDERIRELLKLAYSKYDEVNLFIFSDHGMTDVFDTYDLMGEIKKLNLRFGKDYAVVYDSTIARFWFLSDKVRKLIFL